MQGSAELRIRVKTELSSEERVKDSRFVPYKLQMNWHTRYVARSQLPVAGNAHVTKLPSSVVYTIKLPEFIIRSKQAQGSWVSE